MNVFSKVTLEGLKKNRARTVVTIIGVALSAAMIMAVASFIVSLQSYLLNMVIANDGDWHAKFTDADSAFVQKLNADNEVDSTALVQNIGYALLDGGQNPDKPYLFIAGFSDEAFDTVPVKLMSGRLPQNGGEVVIPEHVRSSGGVEYAIGDTLTLEVGSRIIQGERLNQTNRYVGGEYDESGPESFVPEAIKSYTVVGICKRPDFELRSAPGYTVITKMESADSGIYDVYIKLKSAGKIYEYVAREHSGFGFYFNQDYLRFSGVSDNDSFNTVLYTLGGILIALIMAGSVLLIYNSFSISVSERTRQFGILSSVGATKKQLRKSVLFEGACIGLVGIPFGIIAGAAGIGVTLMFVSNIFSGMTQSDVPLTLSISPAAAAVSAILGIAVILISAYIPAKRAVSRSAIDSIRQTSDITVKARAVKTSRLTTRLFGLEGMLARKNFKRNKKRYRTTIISLFVSIVLFVSASAFGMYMKQSTEMTFDVWDFDIAFDSYNIANGITIDDMFALYEAMKNAEGVYESGYRMDAYFTSEIPVELFSDRFKEYMNTSGWVYEETFEFVFYLFLIDDESYSEYLRDLGLPEAAYMDGGKLPAVGRFEGYDGNLQRIVSIDVFGQNGDVDLLMKPAHQEDSDGMDVTLTLSDRNPADFSQANHTVLTVFAPYSSRDRFNVGADRDHNLMLTFLAEEPQKAMAEMLRIIEEAGFTPPQYRLSSVVEMQEQNRNILLVVNVFTYGFIVLMSLITVANVFNTVSTNINLRRREFAMLKSVGLTDRGFNRMMNYECALYGIKALLYGLPVSAAVTWLIYQGVAAGVDVPFGLPWASIGISVLGVFVVVFVTMLYSISKVKKDNTIDALKSDLF